MADATSMDRPLDEPIPPDEDLYRSISVDVCHGDVVLPDAIDLQERRLRVASTRRVPRKPAVRLAREKTVLQSRACTICRAPSRQRWLARRRGNALSSTILSTITWPTPNCSSAGTAMPDASAPRSEARHNECSSRKLSPRACACSSPPPSRPAREPRAGPSVVSGGSPRPWPCRRSPGSAPCSPARARASSPAP